MKNVLICFGEKPELIEMLTDYENENYYWWCKNIQAKDNLEKYITRGHIILNPYIKLNCVTFDLELDAEILKVLSRTMVYDVNLHNKDIEQLPRELVYYALFILREANRILDDLKPSLVVIKAGTRIDEATFLFLAESKNIPYLVTERGIFHRSLFLDKNNVGMNLMRGSKLNIDRKIDFDSLNRFVEFYKDDRSSAWEQPERKDQFLLRREFGIDGQKKIFVCIGQVEDDANIVIYSPVYKRNQQFLDAVIEIASHDVNSVVIYKPHPKELKKIVELNDKKGAVRVIYAKEINVKDVIQIADFVCTINSTVGFESLLLGKPVIVGGYSYYSHRGFTNDLINPDGSLNNLNLNDLITSIPTSFGDFMGEIFQNSLFFMDEKKGLLGKEDYHTIIKNMSNEITNGEIVTEFNLKGSNLTIYDYLIKFDVNRLSVVDLLKFLIIRVWRKLLRM